MSRRFGRNQRRRAREAIAEAQERISNLETSMRMDRALLECQRRQIDEAEAFQREVAELVGREAIIAGVPVKLAFKFQREPGRDSVDVWPHRPPILTPSYAASMDTIRIETLRLLDIEVVADVMRHQMHAMVQFDGARAVYAISATAIRRMREPDLAKMIARDLAVTLIRGMKQRT